MDNNFLDEFLKTVPPEHDKVIEQERELNLRIYLRSITEMGKIHYQKIVDNPKLVFDCLDPKFNFIAMHENGLISFFQDKPSANHLLDIWTNDKEGTGNFFHTQAFVWGWEQSLIKRPD
jgi:hypothetical protein